MKINNNIWAPLKYNGTGKLKFWDGTGYLVIGIAIFTIIFIYIYRIKIRKWFTKKENEKVLWFKNIDSFLQTASIITIIWMIVRVVLFSIQDYPKPWEQIPIHLCRLHMLVICVLLAFKKKQYIIYISYMGFLSGLFGLIFVNLYQYPSGDTQHLSPFDNPESVWYTSGLKYYSVGFDSVFSWDYTTAHYTIMVLPALLCIGFEFKMSRIQFFKSIGLYLTFVIILWFVNWGTSYASNLKWQTNYWYLSPNKINEFHTALGFATEWPQNIFFVPLIALVAYFALYNLVMAASSNRNTRFKRFYSTEWLKSKLKI